MGILQFGYENVIKPYLFRKDAEDAHDFTFKLLKTISENSWMQKMMSTIISAPTNKILEQQLFGMTFAHPVGLAAGLDKNAVAVPVWASLGFGFLEVGTVTPVGQAGNDKPRLFRLPMDQALINRMGFNNAGSEAMLGRLQAFGKSSIPLAVNIGKNKSTPNEQALEDYMKCMSVLYDVADFFVVNISSPNTPNLRELQKSDELDQLLSGLCNHRKVLASTRGASVKPMLVKLAPDMTPEDLEVSIYTMRRHPVDGVIATNTTLSRDGLQDRHRGEMGGLSGKPLTMKSTEVIRSIYRMSEGKFPIIGVGGIFTADDAYAKIKAGASLVELYSGLIYHGPTLASSISHELIQKLQQDGFEHISQAIGVEG